MMKKVVFRVICIKRMKFGYGKMRNTLIDIEYNPKNWTKNYTKEVPRHGTKYFQSRSTSMCVYCLKTIGGKVRDQTYKYIDQD